MTEKRYLSAAETAKLVRKALKAAFPGITFGVTSSTYSMGASITIQWVDGPTTKQVDAVTAAFRGAGFDGMIDLKFNYDAWLMPDGTATIAKCHGSGCTFESYENPKPHPDAERVSFGSDYIHTDRHHSPEFVRRVAAEMQEKTGWKAPEIKEQDSYWSRSRRVRTAYFERGYTPDEDTIESEYTHALYLTPGDGPLVTSFDYAFEEPEPEPEPEPAELAAENAAIHAAEVADIERNRQVNDAAESEQAAEVAPEPEPDPPAPAPAGADSVRDLLLDELRTLATEIVKGTPSEFVRRCVLRKIAAVNDSTALPALVRVGDDLMLIAQAEA